MAETNLSKNREGYGYKYTDLAQIHEYLEQNNMKYYQYIETTDGKDYIMTVPIIDGVEQKPRRGVQIVDAVLNGIKNPAQEQGSATTYARRYSLLMAFGLATEDDDGASLGKPKIDNKTDKVTDAEAKSIYSLMMRKGINVTHNLQKNYGINNTADLTKEQYLAIFKAVNGLPDKEQKNKKEIEQEQMEMYADYMSANADMGAR